MTGNRRIRVFVSSTFRDMVGERDELMAQAWPELRRFCRERQVEFVEVDLRWGIAEEQSRRKETLKLCLDEIHACRPFFIGLLGERYGWVPGPDAFTADLREEQPWLDTLQDRSVTELEIIHGVLREEQMHKRAFFYFRDPQYVDHLPPGSNGAHFASENPAAKVKLDQLKETIRHSRDEQVCRLREIDEQLSGPRDPTVARDLNNTAALLLATNRFMEAEPMFLRVLSIREECFGKEHRHVAETLSNLAILLKDTNRRAEAEMLLRRALSIDETISGSESSDVARDLNNLASLLVDSDRYAEAEPLLRRALAIDERTFGPDHPDVARDLNNLSSSLRKTNRIEAEQLLRRALSVNERIFGPNHPNIARDLNNLAGLMFNPTQLEEADRLVRRAANIHAQFKKMTGYEHPDRVTYKNNLRFLFIARAMKLGCLWVPGLLVICVLAWLLWRCFR